jgi:hypothetical protein
MKPTFLAVVLLMLLLSTSFGQEPGLESVGNIRGQTNVAVEPRTSARVETLKSDNSFARNNPDYAERAGAFYEKEYLEKALEQMAAVVPLNDQQKPATRKILRAFVTDWLESYVSGDGHISKEDLERCLAAMDAKFKGELSQPGYEAYLTWRKDETGDKNVLAFLMNPHFAIPQTPADNTDPSYPEKLADLEILRKHVQRHFQASPAVMAAARRVFDKVSFVGKTDEQVKRMLGEPYEVTTRNQETLWDYMFHNGETGVHRRFVFAASDHEVKRVEELMTE